MGTENAKKEVAPKLSLEAQLEEQKKKNSELSKKVEGLEKENKGLKLELNHAYQIAQSYAMAQKNLINSVKGTIEIALDNIQLINGKMNFNPNQGEK